MPGQLVIAYSEKLLSNYIHHNYCSVFVLGNSKALNANRYILVDCSIIYLTGRSLCDHELSESPEDTYLKEEEEGSTMERSGTSVQVTPPQL